MTEIESKKVTVNQSAENIYNFLLDLNNFHELLPVDKISDWESDGKSCLFKVSGSVTISLVQQALEPYSKIVLSGNEKAPFKYELHIFLNQTESGETEAWQVVKADINPFIKMMVEKPLKNLFDFVADKLAEKYA
jgi:carbon monoxide dehydrogenase subunit G